MDDCEQLRKLSFDALLERVLLYKKELEEERSEFDEYKSSSREIEEMLEQELEESKKIAREKDRRLHLVDTELARTQERFENEKKEMLKIEDSLRKELHTTKSERDTYRSRIRDLEQQNDDLQRADRNNQQVMEDLGTKLNEAMERMALLENELAERQITSEEMYRLREELKERPRLVVGPMRVEKCEDVTPDEPSPLDEKKTIEEREGTIEGREEKEKGEKEGKMDTSMMNTPTRTPLQLSSPVPQGRGFASSVNRIVRDLMIKVNRLEHVLSDLRTHPKTPRA